MHRSPAARGWMAAVAAVAILCGLAVVSAPSLDPVVDGGAMGSVAGRPSVPGAAESSAISRDQAIRALLDVRASAVRRRDEAAFLSSVDPKASPEFWEAQRRLFRNLAAVPFDGWEYEVDGAEVAAVPSTALAEPAEETWAPKVELTYALSKVDPYPTTRSMGYVFTRRAGDWYLHADDGLRHPDWQSWRGPWDFGACEVAATAHGLVIAHEETEELAQRVVRMLDDSVRSVNDLWGRDWVRQVAVVIPDSRAELRAMVGSEFAVDGIAAVAVADRVIPESRRVEGARVVLNPTTAGQLSDPALRVVLQHEITHVAARADTVDGAPMWLLEGFADYVGYRDSVIPEREIAPDLYREIARNGVPTQLPSDRDFHLAGRKLDLAYQQSWSFVDFMVDRIGPQRMVELYRRIANSGSHDTADAALREFTGMSTVALLEAWGQELRRSLN